MDWGRTASMSNLSENIDTTESTLVVYHHGANYLGFGFGEVDVDNGVSFWSSIA
jgi:hypothetical protein